MDDGKRRGFAEREIRRTELSVPGAIMVRPPELRMVGVGNRYREPNRNGFDLNVFNIIQ
jgi:hypothetical protein